MTYIAIYTIISTALLAWVASFWSMEGVLNITIKTSFVFAAVFGAVCVSKVFI